MDMSVAERIKTFEDLAVNLDEAVRALECACYEMQKLGITDIRKFSIGELEGHPAPGIRQLLEHTKYMLEATGRRADSEATERYRNEPDDEDEVDPRRVNSDVANEIATHGNQCGCWYCME